MAGRKSEAARKRRGQRRVGSSSDSIVGGKRCAAPLPNEVGGGHGAKTRLCPPYKPVSPVLGNGIHQRQPALLHFGDGALERRTDVGWLVDRAFAVAAHRARERAEIGFR